MSWSLSSKSATWAGVPDLGHGRLPASSESRLSTMPRGPGLPIVPVVAPSDVMRCLEQRPRRLALRSYRPQFTCTFDPGGEWGPGGSPGLQNPCAPLHVLSVVVNHVSLSRGPLHRHRPPTRMKPARRFPPLSLPHHSRLAPLAALRSPVCSPACHRCRESCPHLPAGPELRCLPW